ncbi:unnamed protein product [Aspergillus oryzae]|nr:unnamed protein product [Aspergillus oryzae]
MFGKWESTTQALGYEWENCKEAGGYQIGDRSALLIESFKQLPPPIPGAKTYVYKTIRDLKLEVDVFIPDNLPYKDTTTAVLFLHGGGWIGGDRTEYCRPLFDEFLAQQYVVASANYKTPTGGGPLISVDVPELTSERISSVVDMERPIASTPPPKSFEDFVFNPRQQVGAEIFRRGLVAEFLLRGLIRHCPDGSTIEWQLPEKGETQEFEIDGISKFPSLPENADCLSPNVPDTWKSRRVFEVAHAVGLVECLDSQGLRHKEHIVDGAHHSFDIGANTGDDIHLNVMLPAVDWIAGVINHH